MMPYHLAARAAGIALLLRQALRARLLHEPRLALGR